MSTSAERSRGEARLRDGTVARLRAVAYDDPVARDLVARVQQEYVDRYGGPDGAAVTPAEFVPPAGLFLVAEVGGEPAGCGAWRRHPEGDAAGGGGTVEVKRVYVVPALRRRGLAQTLVRALEDSARAAGNRSVVLNSGDRQPEALALYTAMGYHPVPGYGLYAEEPDAVFLGRDLRPGDVGPGDGEPGDGEPGEERPWAS
jgi:GNAT superfamily N-acetyltransferase